MCVYVCVCEIKISIRLLANSYQLCNLISLQNEKLRCYSSTIHLLGGARGVMDILLRNRRRNEFKPWTKLFAFHIGLNVLGKGMNPTIILQLNSRTDWAL